MLSPTRNRTLALTWGTGLLALCLVTVLAVIIPKRGRTAARPTSATVER